MREITLTPAAHRVLASSDGMELALVLNVRALEMVADTAIGPAQREFAKKYALMGREALKKHGTGLLARVEAECG